MLLLLPLKWLWMHITNETWELVQSPLPADGVRPTDEVDRRAIDVFSREQSEFCAPGCLGQICHRTLSAPAKRSMDLSEGSAFRSRQGGLLAPVQAFKEAAVKASGSVGGRM